MQPHLLSTPPTAAAPLARPTGPAESRAADKPFHMVYSAVSRRDPPVAECQTGSRDSHAERGGASAAAPSSESPDQALDAESEIGDRPALEDPSATGNAPPDTAMLPAALVGHPHDMGGSGGRDGKVARAAADRADARPLDPQTTPATPSLPGDPATQDAREGGAALRDSPPARDSALPMPRHLPAADQALLSASERRRAAPSLPEPSPDNGASNDRGDLQRGKSPALTPENATSRSTGATFSLHGADNPAMGGSLGPDAADAPTAEAAEPAWQEHRGLQTLAPQPQPAAGRPEIARHVLAHLAEMASRAAAGPVDITLDPDELGRVRMSIVTGESGLSVTILAERGETLELMRRHIDLLAQDFAALGYSDVAFAFGQGERQPAQGDADPAPDRPGEAPSATTISLRPAGSGGLDLRL